MSEPEKISVPDANDKSGAAETALAETGPAASSSEAASDVEALPQPKQLERVPRSQRRGILASLAIVPEVTNPYGYSNGMKWLFTTIVALAGTTSSTGSSILYRKYM
jgi:hypothetical protein